jgi:putative acetyltransferase
MPIDIRATDAFHPQVAELLAQADALMATLYPAESNHLEPVDGLAADHVLLLGAWDSGRLLGCAAVKRLHDDVDGHDYGEIKRVFVRESARGQGLAKRLMAQLHAHLQGQGVPLARLETGIHQAEALALYQSMGYRTRGPYGNYAADPLSVFMELGLASPA